jgi:hypothetical protein
MDQTKDAEIEEGLDERPENRTVKMMEGIMEGAFHTADLVSYHAAFSGTEVPCTGI